MAGAMQGLKASRSKLFTSKRLPACVPAVDCGHAEKEHCKQQPTATSAASHPGHAHLALCAVRGNGPSNVKARRGLPHVRRPTAYNANSPAMTKAIAAS